MGTALGVDRIILEPYPLMLLTLLLFAPLAVPPVTSPGAMTQFPATQPAGALGQSLARLADQDRRLSFTPRTASLARNAETRAERGDDPVPLPGSIADLSEALFGRGAGGDVMAREGLLGRAMDSGATPVGLSSILALGALGPRLGGAQAPLEEWARSADSPRSAHALLALYMAKPEVGQALADELALSHSLAGLLAVHVHPSPLPEHQAVRRWYGLRLGAARRFGLVDGRLWSEILTDRLAKDSTFLEELILAELPSVPAPAVADHLLALLLEDPTPARIRAGVRMIPDSIEALVASGHWTPRGSDGWREMVRAILDGYKGDSMGECLAQAVEQPGSRGLALAAMVRRDASYLAPLEAALASNDAELLLDVMYGAGVTDLAMVIPALRELGEHEDLGVRSEALVVRARLGDGDAHLAIREIMMAVSGGEEDPLAENLMESLERHRGGFLVLDLCEVLTSELPFGSPGRLLALAALRLGGRRAATVDLLGESQQAPVGAPGEVLAREAMGNLPGQGELNHILTYFPSDTVGRTDMVVAGACVRVSRTEVEPLISSALWSGSIHLSLLAAALTRERSGEVRLMLWALEPPMSASSEDLRRVGYCIGQLGGMASMEEISRRLGSSGGTDRPLLQGALLGAMGARTH